MPRSGFALRVLANNARDDVLGQLLAEYDYTLLANGMRSSVKETELESNGTDSTRTFDWVYDALGRLTQEQLTSTLAGESYTDDYTYNLVGDRVELKATAANGTVTDTKSTYNALDQLTQDNTTVTGSSTTTTTNLAYDANGSLLSKITVGGDSYQYTYNVRSELSGATISRTEQGHSVQISASYKYDEAGIRVESDETTTIDNRTPTTATKIFLIDGNNPTGYAQVLEQLAAVGGKPVMSYMLAQQIIGQATAAGAAQYILADGHGSTRLPTDANAAILARFLYDAYGNILGQSFGALNLPATSILYTGQQFDALLLQYYLRARYYDASDGIFSARDTFIGDPSLPMTLEKYAYARNSPVSNWDPRGTDTLGDTLGAMALNAGLSALQNGAIGAVTGGLLGGLDAWLGDEDVWQGAWNGAKWGLAAGVAFGFAAPLARMFLSPAVRALILNLGAGASITLGGLNSYVSFTNGNGWQGFFRLGLGFIGGYSLNRSAVNVRNTPVNIGGEMDAGVPRNAIDLQGRWIFSATWGKAQPSAGLPSGSSLARMLLSGWRVMVYNSQKGRLPFPDNSVPTVYTDSVPIDVNYGKYAGISSSEIKRVLVHGGQWIRDGIVEFTKP